LGAWNFTSALARADDERARGAGERPRGHAVEEERQRVRVGEVHEVPQHAVRRQHRERRHQHAEREAVLQARAELARRAEAHGVSWITVHGRTRCQFYKGEADWRAIADVKQSVSLPVIANGDCASLDDAKTMLSQSNADGIMVGRAALGQPWLVGQIARALAGEAYRETEIKERQDAVNQHYDDLLSLYGVEIGIRHARKHLAAYLNDAIAQGAQWPEAERLELLTSTDPHIVTERLSCLYETIDRREAA